MPCPLKVARLWVRRHLTWVKIELAIHRRVAHPARRLQLFLILLRPTNRFTINTAIERRPCKDTDHATIQYNVDIGQRRRVNILLAYRVATPRRQSGMVPIANWGTLGRQVIVRRDARFAHSNSNSVFLPHAAKTSDTEILATISNVGDSSGFVTDIDHHTHYQAHCHVATSGAHDTIAFHFGQVTHQFTSTQYSGHEHFGTFHGRKQQEEE